MSNPVDYWCGVRFKDGKKSICKITVQSDGDVCADLNECGRSIRTHFGEHNVVTILISARKPEQAEELLKDVTA